MLHVTTWLWGDKYGDDDVRKLFNAVRRNLDQAHRFVLITDRYRPELPPGIVQYGIINTEMTKVPGCFARLRLFDPVWQHQIGVDPGDRIFNLDLDVVVTRGLDPLVDVDHDFAILQGVNTSNPCPFNGSVWLLKARAHPGVWCNDIVQAYAARGVAAHAFPDDQGWLHHCIPDAAPYGVLDGVYAFQKRCWPEGDDLPPNARIVAFPGWRSPAQFEHLDWVQKHWR